jgi:hypothetical protein
MSKRSEGQHEPPPRGFVPTPLKAFEPLAPYLPPGCQVIEPMAGDGALCAHLYETGCEIVAATDIAPQHPNVAQMDVMDYDLVNTPKIDYFVSNPPWPEPRKNGLPTLPIINHLRNIAPTLLLLPSDFMFNVYAAEVMGYCGAVIAVGRVKWIPDSPHEGYDNAAWYLFGKNDNGGKIVFIPRAGATQQAV